jgi:hypothetical protein
MPGKRLICEGHILGFEDLAIGAASCCRAKQDLSGRSFLANLRV